MRASYILYSLVIIESLLSLAVLSPIYLTPDWYIWTVVSVILMLIQAGSLAYWMQCWYLEDDVE